MQRGATVAAANRLAVGAGVQQNLRQPSLVGVTALVQGGPAVRVGMRGIRVAVQQQADNALVALCRRHTQRIVAVGALGSDNVRPVIEHHA